jgi:hypothetical protein
MELFENSLLKQVQEEEFNLETKMEFCKQIAAGIFIISNEFSA